MKAIFGYPRGRADEVRSSPLLRAALLLCASSLPLAALAADTIFRSGFEDRPLNDTGIVWSGHATNGNASFCDPAHPAGQDCHFGRDAAAAAGTLQKVGASTPNNGIDNGFDYTKISNSGNPLPESAVLGDGPDDWACTRDNVTGLIWEVKTASGLRSQDHTYTWYDSTSPDGNPGTASGGSCETAGRCDTEKFVADVNALGLCGANDWRMPSVKELEGIADLGRYNPAIDPGFFPNTPSSDFWSDSPNANNSSYAWVVGFNYGDAYGYINRSTSNRVRLARVGQ